MKSLVGETILFSGGDEPKARSILSITVSRYSMIVDSTDR